MQMGDNLKVTENDGKPKYKAKLVAKGFKQQQGIDFDEIFFLVVKMTTLRCVLALVAKEDTKLVQMDVKIALLHGDLHEGIYMLQPEDFVVKSREHLGIDCLYTKRVKGVSLLILILYVDDMLLAEKNIDELAALQSKLNDNFDMKDIGDANHILGMRIVQDRDK
ncbi:hypothetical protein L7F22_043451 [Adiantum nelumboides]|nr:hypothetical protein [Adiantum nelumboides]